MSRLPFLATVAAVALLSFLWLAGRSRPMRGGPGVEPVLYAAGLHQPRGLSVGADGALYVAEAGWSSPGAIPVAGRVSRVGAREESSVFADGLPAAETGQPLFRQSGPGSLVAAGDGLVLFLGPAEGRPQGSLARLSVPGGELAPAVPLMVQQTPAGAGAAVWGATGAPAGGGSLQAVLPLANVLVRIDPGSGAAVPVTPFIGAGGANPLPAGIARAPDGTLVVAHFGADPDVAGQAIPGRVVQVAPDGRWQPVVENLRFPIAVAFGPGGLLYVLEFASGYDAGNRRYLPNSGRVLAIGPEPTRRQVVVREVDYPTALTFSPTGDLYVAEGGVFRGPGEGRVLFVPGQTLQQVSSR